MYTFLSHSPGALRTAGKMGTERTEDGVEIDWNAVLAGINYFGYDLEKDIFGEFEVITLEPFSRFLHSFSHYALQAMYVDGFGEGLEKMAEESGSALLYPKFTRDYIMENLNLAGKMEFKELPKKFRESDYCKSLRYQAVTRKYGGIFARQPHKCPVCGKHTFERYEFERCPVCGYVDAYVRAARPDRKEGYPESLNEAKARYRKQKRR